MAAREKASARAPVGARRRVKARETQIAFEALSIEGGLLSPEWLARAAQRDAGQQSEADYRVPRGLALRDEIGRYWRIAQAHWADLRAGMAAKAEPQALAERFVLALLKEAFGFASLEKAAPVELEGRTFPIGHQALAGRVPVVIAPAGSGLDALAPAFGDGGRRRSAFGLAQELLNAQQGVLWGLATDGLTLRVLRDNASLTRPAWIEADLGRMFGEERYADFAALWLIAHETRFGDAEHPPADCPLERWRAAGREEGTRAREHLRTGVEEALVALGRGFLVHPENQPLRAALQGGQLTKEAYFQELLRLVYRLIFLLTAEERGLLHPEGTADRARGLYEQGYGLRRLRDRAVKRSAHDRFGDLWEGLEIVLRGVAAGESRLGLPALGGLFAADQCPHLEAAKLENRALLTAVFRLSWLKEAAGLSRVNWRDMGPEELGSVYESLLELVPIVPENGRGFAFATGDETKGNARKTTGSYYTPDSLVQVLLDSALEPVVKETVAKNLENPAEALLRLTVVDPACGSGHFLLAAARRLAVHVARLQAGGTPSAAEYRHALRQVVSRCLFGVDLNPMAVELCRVSLWMEAVEPGRPLSFLDSHIQRGNALLGATPELMKKGIPDAAFEPIEGDDKKTASLLKKRNKAAAAGQRGLDSLWSKPAEAEGAEVARAVAALEAAPDSSLEEVAGKEAQWEGLQRSLAFTHQKLVADAWCAAFVWPKPPTEPKKVDPIVEAAPTNDLWRQLRDGQGQPPALTVKTVAELAGQYHFFHWHLAFPQVFARGGFDVVLGNPPWERLKIQEREFFSARVAEPERLESSAGRDAYLAVVAAEFPALWTEWLGAKRGSEAQAHLIRNSMRFERTASGDLNLFPLFGDLADSVLRASGRCALLLPQGIVTDKSYAGLFINLLKNQRLVAVRGFVNEKMLFPAVMHNVKFCIFSFAGQDAPGTPCTRATFSFDAETVSESFDAARVHQMSAEDVRRLNPETETCPIFDSGRSAAILARIYESMPTLSASGFAYSYGHTLHMKNAGRHFRPRGSGGVPVLESKMIYQYNHRSAGFDHLPPGEHAHILPPTGPSLLQDPGFEPSSCYELPEKVFALEVGVSTSLRWRMVYRRITSLEVARTVVACIVPNRGLSDSLMIVDVAPSTPTQAEFLLSCFNSVPFDFAARCKQGGRNLSQYVFDQLPVPPVGRLTERCPWNPAVPLAVWLTPRVLELTYTADSLSAFASDCGYAGPPFRWFEERRADLRAELDGAFLHLFGIARDDAEHLLDSFWVVRNREIAESAEYRTKRVILEIYDEMAEAMRTGKPYRTRLDPPPADPRVAHAARPKERNR